MPQSLRELGVESSLVLVCKMRIVENENAFEKRETGEGFLRIQEEMKRTLHDDLSALVARTSASASQIQMYKERRHG